MTLGVCIENLGKKENVMRNGFCQAGKVISRASRAVSPRLKQVSDEEEVQETEESMSDVCYTGLTTSRK